MTVNEAKVGQPYLDSWDDLILYTRIDDNGVVLIEINKFSKITFHEVSSWFKKSQTKLIPIERSIFVKAIFEGI